MAVTDVNSIITQENQLDDNSGYGYFYDIEDIPDNPTTIYVSFIQDEESDTDMCIYTNQLKNPQNGGNLYTKTLISISVITVIIIYILIII